MYVHQQETDKGIPFDPKQPVTITSFLPDSDDILKSRHKWEELRQ